MIANIDITNVKLETDRLILRPFRQEDLDDFYEYASVDGVGEMAGWKHHDSKVETQRILDIFIQNRLTFAIVYKANNKVIGSVGIETGEREVENDSYFDNYSIREIGYVLSKDYWGQAIMPEAVSRVIKYCFEETTVDLLLCGHYLFNQQSKRVIEKCGFEFYKEAIHHLKQLERDEKCKVYILKKS